MKILSGSCFMGLALTFTSMAFGQLKCASADYIQFLIKEHPGVAPSIKEAEDFIAKQKIASKFSIQSKEEGSPTIHIPVVVHVLYQSNAENISDDQIKSQISALNRDYRRQNADTINTPLRFKAIASDINIDFDLATSDPSGRATMGIIRKHTNVTWWQMNDEMKFSESGGDDAWDSRNYLNIWVCNLQGLLGYSSIPGSPAEKDGVVIASSAFGTIYTAAPYNMGRTAVHEIGHWLGLKHLWGDSFCGDDFVEDTPKQGSFTIGCPGGAFISSCDNGTMGDMYMNYMDFTDDACMNLFTAGQKSRILTFFNQGGPRNSILFSRGLEKPWVFTSLPKNEGTALPKLQANIYPNPALSELNIVIDNQYIGKDAKVISVNGNLVISQRILSTSQKINIENLKPGMYFLEIANSTGKFRQRFLKL